MSLAREVQKLLEDLKFNPDRPLIRSRELPPSLTREIRRHVVQKIQEFPDEVDLDLIRYLNNFYRVPYELQDFYIALLDVGVDDDGVLKRLLLWFLEARILRIPTSSSLTRADELILALTEERQRHAFRLEEYELMYAVENHLCHHNDGQWQITGLGRVLLRLPVLQATRFLLTLEIFLHAGEWDDWHMSRDFLWTVKNKGIPHLDLRPSNKKYPVVWNEYIERLQEFDLATSLPEQDEKIKLTKLGRLTINSVLMRDSAFDGLVPLYIREEIVGIEASNFNSEEDIERFRKLLETSQLVAELKQPILDEVNRLLHPNAAYLSVFKAMAPCIEGVLRNVAHLQNITVKGNGLNAYIKAFESAPQPIIKSGTLQMIDAVFRPYRNIVEHGHVIAPEPARMLCEISLSVIEEIHKDYQEYKER